MHSVVDCKGAPRDLGLDEACAQREVVRAELQRAAQETRALPAALRRQFSSRVVAKAVTRHFPHLAERTAGLTKGVGLARKEIWPLFVREMGFRVGCQGSTAGLGLGLCAARTGSGPILAKTLDLPPGREHALLLRRSAPDNDFRSLELSLAGFPSALAGVNEKGLAVMVCSSEAEADGSSRIAAPPMLFVQDCLQRFSNVANAMEWCMTRPVGGNGTLLLADQSGALVGVDIQGERRTALEPVDGMLCVGRPQAVAAAEPLFQGIENWSEQAFVEVVANHLDAQASAQAGDRLSKPSDESLCRHDAQLSTLGAVWIDPVTQRLAWQPGRPCARDLQVEQL
jgi:hypothetical protein